MARTNQRRDKQQQWDALDEILSQHRQIAAKLNDVEPGGIKLAWYQDELQALSLLKSGPRLDAGQIRLIRKLVQAVIRVERNCEP